MLPSVVGSDNDMEPADADDARLPEARLCELRAVAERVGHPFRSLSTLQRALCHASTGNERKANYERLEFLGDAILNFLVAEELYRHTPEIPVGQLTELRARLVARAPLAEIADALGLSAALEGGRGLRAQDRASRRIQADLVEAVLAAVFLDGGIDAARRFTTAWILPGLPAAQRQPAPTRDAKSRISHLAQTMGRGQPTYEIVAETGPPHERLFEVACLVGGRALGQGSGRTRQAAEKLAASRALEILDAELLGDAAAADGDRGADRP